MPPSNAIGAEAGRVGASAVVLAAGPIGECELVHRHVWTGAQFLVVAPRPLKGDFIRDGVDVVHDRFVSFLPVGRQRAATIALVTWDSIAIVHRARARESPPPRRTPFTMAAEPRFLHDAIEQLRQLGLLLLARDDGERAAVAAALEVRLPPVDLVRRGLAESEAVEGRRGSDPGFDARARARRRS